MGATQLEAGTHISQLSKCFKGLKDNEILKIRISFKKSRKTKYVNGGPSCENYFQSIKFWRICCFVGMGISGYPNSVGTWWLLMIFKRNSVNLLMQLNAIVEQFPLLCMKGKKPQSLSSNQLWWGYDFKD